MSNNPSNLAPADAKAPKSSTRKMTQNIIADKEKEKEVFEFFEDDDDFEEFENDEMNYDDVIAQGGDVDMSAGDSKTIAK